MRRTAQRRAEQASQEACDIVEDEEDEHLLSQQGLLPGTVARFARTSGASRPPPPEEEKHVTTAIGAARANRRASRSASTTRGSGDRGPWRAMALAGPYPDSSTAACR